MKKIKSIILVYCLIWFGITNLAAQNIKVSTVKELFNQIGANKTIELAEGTYNFTQIALDTTNPNINWTNNYDGFEPIISDIDNLTLVGNGKVFIVIEPRYAWVMNFYNCNNLNFSGLTFGHTVAGSCLGGVLSFTSCSNINIDKCALYGSGTVGILTDKCKNFFIKECDIHDCTYGLAYLYDSENINFEKTTFRKTGEYNLFEITGCDMLSFLNCTFTENYNSSLFPYFFSIDNENGSATEPVVGKQKSKNLKIEKCTFKDNNVQEFSNDRKKIKFINNIFSGNTFKNP